MQLQYRHWFATVRIVMNYGMFWLLQCLSEVKCQIYWNLCFVSWQRGIHSNKTFQSDVTNTMSICTEVFMQRWYSAFKRQLSETHSLHGLPYTLCSPLTLKLAGKHSALPDKLTEKSSCRKEEIGLPCSVPISLTRQCHRTVTEKQIWLHRRVRMFITAKNTLFRRI